MKKILAIIAVGWCSLWAILVPFAHAASWETEITVSEKIPGMDCSWDEKASVKTRKFVCKIKPGFWSVMQMLAGFIKYLTFIVALVGVLMLVYSGIEMSVSGIGGKKDEAKKRIEKIILWLVLLFAMGLILNTVAPWIYQ